MGMKFDFRTKLLVIALTMSLVAVLTSDILIYTLLVCLCIYLLIQGFYRQAIKYFAVCCVFILLRLFSGGNGITFLMPEMFLFMVLRILMMVMAAQPVFGMPPGEVVAVLKELMRKLKQAGHTIVVAEHRLYYLTDLADRFLYMENGRLQKEWSAMELLQLSELERKSIGIRTADLQKIETIPPVQVKKTETISVENLSFAYRKNPVFEDLSFKAYAGDLIAIIGHNGVGKSTLSNIMCGIKKENAGNILYCGKKVSRKRRKDFAYFVMQNTESQFFGDSVAEELRLNRKKATDTQIKELLTLYGLSEWSDFHPATLSGGQKQRLTLAVSDWIDTPILILDEPTSGLDFQNMQRISDHLKSLTEKGKTILVITHDYEFAAMTCNRALYFSDRNHIDDFPIQGNLEKLYSCLMAH